MAVFDPIKVLSRILDSLQQIDQCRYFALPVTDAEAPGYHTVPKILQFIIVVSFNSYLDH